MDDSTINAYYFDLSSFDFIFTNKEGKNEQSYFLCTCGGQRYVHRQYISDPGNIDFYYNNNITLHICLDRNL